jgi:hypothetical protein
MTEQTAKAMDEGETGETLEQYADRVVASTRKKMMDHLDDDVIGCLGDSHLIFGKACAMEAVTTAMQEMQAYRAAMPATQPAQVGDLVEALNKIANARTAMDGGSISECRQIARAALTAQEKKRDD